MLGILARRDLPCSRIDLHTRHRQTMALGNTGPPQRNRTCHALSGIWNRRLANDGAGGLLPGNRDRPLLGDNRTEVAGHEPPHAQLLQQFANAVLRPLLDAGDHDVLVGLRMQRAGVPPLGQPGPSSTSRPHSDQERLACGPCAATAPGGHRRRQNDHGGRLAIADQHGSRKHAGMSRHPEREQTGHHRFSHDGFPKARFDQHIVLLMA